MTIKEVEQYLDVPRATVRFYEKEGFIHPGRGENGYREYTKEDVDRLKQIIIFRKLGMALTDIEDVLDGTKSLSETMEKNIVNLEKQMDELKGALVLCHRIQEEKEEIETFEADKYWNVMVEEERKGNQFLDTAKDMVHFEKSIVLEYFGIADIEGNLSVSIPKAIGKIVACIALFIVVTCILEGEWTIHNILGGIKNLFWMILLEVVVGIPLFIAGRKRPELLKKRTKLMFFVCLGLFILCILILVCCKMFGW